MSQLDEIDAKIIEILKQDSRTPFTEIASKLGVSDSTIHVRLKKLKDDGILRGFTVDLNEERLGLKIHGFAMISVKMGYLEEVVSNLVQNKRINKIYETHGSNDLVALIAAADLNELREVMMEIRKTDNISSTSLTTILKIWK